MIERSKRGTPIAKTRSAMSAPTLAEKVPAADGQRLLVASDGRAFGALLYHAYHGTVDDDGEVLQDGLDIGPGLLAEARENLIRPCSAGIWQVGQLVAAVLTITLNDDHWIDPIIVHPDFKRHGLGTHLMRWASSALHTMSVEKLRLAVTDSNEPALALYQKLGYSRDGPWPPPD